MPVNLSTWGQRQKDWKFQDNLGYKVNMRPKWTAQGDSISENKHNKPPGQKGPQVKTGPLKTCSSFPFLSCEGYSYSLNSWASCSLSQEGQPWNSDSLGFRGTSSSFVLSYFEFSTKRISAQHVVQTPQHFCSRSQHLPHCAITKGLF